MDEELSISSDVQETFYRAAGYVAEKAQEMAQADLLYFYGRYKQALEGPCKEPIPSLFSFRKRSKWEAWHSLGEMSQEEAMEQYVDKLNAIVPDWDSKSGENKPKKSFGPVISTFLKTDPDLEDESKTPFDWVKEGNVEQLKQSLDANKSIIYCRDEQGLSLLHWACDRGYLEVATLLISCGINVDCQDEDGQTALHYACSCGHETLVHLLLKNGALPNLPDSEGLLPQDVAFTPAVKELVLVEKK